MPSDEYLKEVTIGAVEERNGTITLHAYDPAWPEQYLSEQKKIMDALQGEAITVEHVGSTSVPGLCAKPILDILLLVEDAGAEERYVPALEQAGYVLRIREPDWYQHRMLKGSNPAVNLHVFSTGCEEARRMLRFRDWLRSHPKDRKRYACAKQELARQTWTYVQNYADAKSEVVAEIFRHMEAADWDHAEPQKPKVAFLCVHNSCRSQMAEALGKQLAGDVFESFSAGTEPGARINPDAVRLVKEIYGIDMTQAQHNKPLSALPAVDIVVTMGCNVQCPTFPCSYREDWGLDDPSGQEDAVFRAVLSRIEANVLDLKRRIQAGELTR